MLDWFLENKNSPLSIPKILKRRYLQLGRDFFFSVRSLIFAGETWRPEADCLCARNSSNYRDTVYISSHFYNLFCTKAARALFFVSYSEDWNANSSFHENTVFFSIWERAITPAQVQTVRIHVIYPAFHILPQTCTASA